MALKLANNAVSKLASAIAAGDTSIALTTGDGAKFPTLSAGDWFPVTFMKSDGTFEIAKCTARSGDTLTVTRGQEGTTAVAFTANSLVELRLTKAATDEFARTSDTTTGFASGALIGIQVFTASGTYTPTTGTKSVTVEVQAPGGGGGGVSATGSGQVALAQSGSGGSYAKVRITSGFSGATVTIGAAGTGGAAGTNAGTAGGTTSFGSFVSCPGGTAGAGSAAVSPPNGQSYATLPAAPTITGATTLISTSGGTGAAASAPTASTAFPATGGDSMMGMGKGTGNGSGGNGAAIPQNTAATAGGNGSPGKIIVYEYA